MHKKRTKPQTALAWADVGLGWGSGAGWGWDRVVVGWARSCTCRNVPVIHGLIVRHGILKDAVDILEVVESPRVQILVEGCKGERGNNPP